MDTTLVLREPILGELEEKVRLPVESGGVLLARRCHTGNGNLRLLARSIHWVPESAYIRRTSREMLIPPEGYVPALGAAEQDNAVPLWLHTHPAAEPSPSNKDRQVDVALADVFRLRSGADLYGTVIVSTQPNGLTFTGTVQEADSGPEAIDRFWMVGDRWRLTEPFDANRAAVDSGMFDRNIRAFGEPVQRTIGLLRIAVVGAGGTGSAVAEQLVRLGARHIILVDADTLSESNLTRVYGATPDQVRRPKAEALAMHLKSIAPDLKCRTARRDVHHREGCSGSNGRRPHLRLHRRQRRTVGALAAFGLLSDPGDRPRGSSQQRLGEATGGNPRASHGDVAGPGLPALPRPSEHGSGSRGDDDAGGTESSRGRGLRPRAGSN